MAEIKIFDGAGASSGTLAAPDKLERANAKVTLVHQVMVAELAGKRQGTAKTKRRDEVAGSGVKIRRQKGTGRSRQGDKRTPHMRGGGVVHGPRPRDYSQNTPRKMRRAAFATALNSRLQNDRLFVLDGASFETPKTRQFVALLSAMELSELKVLFLTAEGEDNLQKSARNLPKVKIGRVGTTSLVDVLGSEAIVCTRAAWDEMAQRLDGNTSKGAAGQKVEAVINE